MFGYVRADTPYLFIKDDVLYRAMYCGLCKGIAQSCGNSARMGLSYDITFLSVILHNIAGIDVKIEKSHCATHCIRTRQMACTDELTQKLGAFVVILLGAANALFFVFIFVSTLLIEERTVAWSRPKTFPISFSERFVTFLIM